MPYLDSSTYDLPYVHDSDTSREAAEQARKFVGPQGELVRAWFMARGAYGGTQREAAEALNLGRPSMCARCHALEQTGQIVKLPGTTRQRCAVYVSTQ